jgi:hypothetical protein
MMPAANNAKGELSRNRPQRFGGLRGGFDLGNAVGVERRRRGDDDEEGNQVGEGYPNPGVDGDQRERVCKRLIEMPIQRRGGCRRGR